MLNPGVLSNEQISINKKKVKKVFEFQSSNSIKNSMFRLQEVQINETNMHFW